MTNPDISVIICTCNRAERLPGLFENLKQQVIVKPGFTWELVLVDNNSTDRTREIVDGYREEGVLSIQYIFERRQGKCFALNTGVRVAGGELLAFTDDDVKLDDHWLSAVHEAFRKYPHGGFGGKVLPLSNPSLPAWLASQDTRNLIYGGALVKHDWGDEIREYDGALYAPIGANMFIRKRMFEKYGFFNTRLGYLSSEVNIGSEDSEIMFRFKSGGDPILYYPEALVFHPVETDRMKKAYFRKWWWGNGRGRARWFDATGDGIRYLNVPRYLFRRFVADLALWTISFIGKSEYKRFYREMKVLYTLGTMYEFYMSEEQPGHANE